eukprot:augustus_masked-scaffold_5-processed-gene-7.51-mRNA-1 protein AED:1.00 eAED:1.00 QI:0/-1/0/0/-1/1/1/0/89
MLDKIKPEPGKKTYNSFKNTMFRLNEEKTRVLKETREIQQEILQLKKQHSSLDWSSDIETDDEKEVADIKAEILKQRGRIIEKLTRARN